MRVAIACDHAAVEAKRELLQALGTPQNGMPAESEVIWIDLGTDQSDSVDYPDFAEVVCRKVLSGEADFGVLLCGSGVGMSMAANKFRGIRAALVTSPELAKLSRLHNNANVLCLGSRTTASKLLPELVRIFLSTSFEGCERHERRIRKLHLLEQNL
jgi:ribose 5-phosphate isomerase B